KTLLKIEVENVSDHTFYVPLNVYIDTNIELVPDRLVLVKKEGSKSISIPFQIKNNQLGWIVQGGEVKQTFELKNARKASRYPQLNDNTDYGLLVIDFNDRDLLGYQFGFMDAPEGVDPAYGRSGFIHPLWSPKGQVLTRVQP